MGTIWGKMESAVRFVFWENIVSPHRSAFLRALAERGHECTLIVDEVADARRLAMGWKVPDLGNVRIVANPDDRTMRAELDAATTETIHVLGGYRSCRTTRFACARCVAEKRRFGICAERGQELGWKQYVRRLLAKWDARRYRAHFDFILPMGLLGVRWYRRAGYEEPRLFPFQYTVENVFDGDTDTMNDVCKLVHFDSDATCSGDSIFRVLYVGTFWSVKGPDLLIRSLASLKDIRSWRAIMIGRGVSQNDCMRQAHSLGIESQVRFPGYQFSDLVTWVMRSCDCVVVPSRHDGWCAVVNEALQVGTPVICSDRVGASCVVAGRPELGDVYPCNDTERLGEILRRRIADGRITPERRLAIRAWSQRIQGPAVAEYFERVMRHVYEQGKRPMPPWDQEGPWEETR